VIFTGIALKLEKVGSTSSLPFTATEDIKQFYCLNTVLNNKTWPLIIYLKIV